MGLLNVRVVAERVTIFALCVLLPAVIGISMTGGSESVLTLMSRWALFSVPAGAAAFSGSIWITRIWNLHYANVPPSADDKSLVADAAKEFIGNKADARLVQEAKRLVPNEDGRIVATYITMRLVSMRRERAVESGEHQTSPTLPVVQRALWSGLLLFTTTLILILLPQTWPEAGIQPLFMGVVVLAVPLWATAVQVALFGDSAAAQWLSALLGRFKRPPRESKAAREPTPTKATRPIKAAKLKQPESKRSDATQWHMRGQGGSRPIARVVLLGLLMLIGGMYALRQYTPTENASAYVEGFQLPESDEEERDPSSPREFVPTTPSPNPSRPEDVRRTPANIQPQDAIPTYWKDLQQRGSLVYVDPNALAASGRDLNSITQIFGRNRRRIEDWLVDARQRKPDIDGRMAIEIVIQPYGWVSSTRVIKSETGEPWFDAGVTDRIDTLNFGEGAAQPLRIIYSIDF